MPTHTPTIFIVDDEPLLTEMLSDYLLTQDDQLDIRTFGTGEACLAALNNKPDLIILDYYLNSRSRDAANGIDILKAIKSRERVLPVIMLSGQSSYGTAAKTIQYGATHYIRKGQEAFPEIYELLKANV